jgi:uncharacterized caspase-like protein
MRKSRLAGAVALAIVSFSLLSAEVIRNAVAQQIQPAAQARSLASAGEPAGEAGATRLAALVEPAPAEVAAPAAPAGTVAPTGSAEPARRVALVIGNAEYPDDDTPLSHPVKDAQALADELRRRGFDVEQGENVTQQAMARTIERFKAKIAPGATALLFYSGHGAQIGRESYLLPVNAQIWRPEDVKRDGVSLETLVTEMDARGAKLKLVVLDAARRNPFERRLRGFSGGLAPIAGREDTLVLYSVAPGKVADHTEGENSLFVTELLKEIGAPGLTIEEAFNRTRVGVVRASRGQQVPAVFSSLAEDAYFAERDDSAPSRQSAR